MEHIHRPHQKWPLALGSKLAAQLESRGWLRPSFDADDMMEHASRSVGLTDFGDDSFREPFGILTDDLDNRANFHALGRFIHQRYVTQFLKNRLLIQKALKEAPLIRRECIQRPLIIIGLPRTGTSHLMNLLSHDEAHRTLSFWEGSCPAPAPNEATYRRDRRRLSSALVIATANYLIPELEATHKLRLDGPEECILLLANSFRSQLFLVEYNTPHYTEWLMQCDHRPAYREHKEQLQILQSGIKRERWLLKSPTHMIGIDGLLDVYPDAMIVQTHRNPQKAIPSICSLSLNTRAVASHELRPDVIGEQMLGHLAPAMQRFMDVRDRAPKEQFFDVMYDDLVADPMHVVHDIYNHFGLSLSPASKMAMQQELTKNPKNKHGAHRYTVEQFALDNADIAQRFAPYMERFGLVSDST